MSKLQHTFSSTLSSVDDKDTVMISRKFSADFSTSYEIAVYILQDHLSSNSAPTFA